MHGAVVLASSLPNHDDRSWSKTYSESEQAYFAGYADGIKIAISKTDALIVAGRYLQWKESERIIQNLKTELLPAGTGSLNNHF